MIGAIIGDIVGSVYEFNNIRIKNFPIEKDLCSKTDDSVMTLAVIDSLLNDLEITSAFKKWFRKYPMAGFGNKFTEWCLSDSTEPYNSFGNGAAMRISPVGWFAKSEDEIKALSKRITECTHNHPEGIKGAEVVSMCIYYALNNKSKDEIKEYIKKNYKIDFDYNELVENYRFDETCQGSIPQALYCFLISDNFEDCLRTSISIGGDSDTIAAISCSIAEAYYKQIPDYLIDIAKYHLTEEEKRIIDMFCKVCEERKRYA